MNSEARPDAPVRYGKGGPNARCGPMSDDSGDEEGSGDESRALRAHKYLGTLQAVAKPKEIRDGAKAVLPLIVFSQLVLFPGETLPLIIPSGVDGFGSIIDGKCAVGILWAEHADGRWRLSRVGTVAQVVSTVVSVHSDRARVICKGMRRFTLLGSMARQGRLHHGDVFVHKLDCGTARLPPEAGPHAARVTPGRAPLARRRLTGNASALAPWVHALHEPRMLARRCWDQLNAAGTLSDQTPPRDAASASFWLAHRAPLSNAQRHRLLRAPSAVSRLSLLRKIMASTGFLTCSGGRIVTENRHIFGMVRAPRAHWGAPRTGASLTRLRRPRRRGRAPRART